jgi:hypothetical protein
MKKTACILLILAVLLALGACGKKDTWRTDVPLSSLAETVEKHLDAGSLAAMQESYLKGAMKLDPSIFSEWLVKINAYGANIDEYGIFKAPDEAGVAAVREAAEGYLKLRRDTWMEEYMPEEKPKLTQAEVKVCGLYVFYTIVSDDVRAQIASDLENALKK